MKKALSLLLLIAISCQKVPESATPIFYITGLRNENARKLRDNCVFRYKIENKFERLNDQIQQSAVKAALEGWQTKNTNIRFLRYQGSNPEIALRFIPNTVLENSEVTAPLGLVRGKVMTLSSFKKENTNTQIILLNADFDWDAAAITRVVMHQTGLYLGLNTATDLNSAMNPVFQKGQGGISKADSTLVNNLYPQKCILKDFNLLPQSLSVNKPTTAKIILDKQTPIVIKATGGIRVGLFIGISTPKGLERGLFNFPIDEYNIVPDFNHGALMYRINDNPTWTYCGDGCEIETDGVSEYIEITFGINDNNLLDNSGTYTIAMTQK